MSNATDLFEKHFFTKELNRFVGSGGELLLKSTASSNAPATRMDIGDRLIGIGITHFVESLSRPAGPDAFHALTPPSADVLKSAARAFIVTDKKPVDGGYSFGFAPLSPKEYSDTLRLVSNGKVRIAPETIPDGTIIMSFLAQQPGYTLAAFPGSPDDNWVRATSGERQWNVGFGNGQDFWAATFPSDDIGLLPSLSPAARVGTISFGLSLLAGSKTQSVFHPVPCTGPSGSTTMHQFCLLGAASGTMGLSTPFPIGLRTEILFKPEANLHGSAP